LIEIVDYDPAWPAMFESERRLIQPLLQPFLVARIEHIGSTSVPGLAAKPVIDIMAPVADLDSSRPAIEALRQAGYLYAPYRADVMHWLCKPSPTVRTHHLHLVPYASAQWKAPLAFRDALAADQALAKEYVELKRRLAREHRDDRDGYTDGKAGFVAAAIAR
jgi:GrpB-like predicted nucleotidyltransferase (UPF0157 family)